MKRRAIIRRAAAVGWLACLLTGSAWAANGPAGPGPVGPAPAPAPAAPTATVDPHPRAAPPAPMRSPLDSEPIRRSNGGVDSVSGTGGSEVSPGLELGRVGLALAIVLSLIFIGRLVMRRVLYQVSSGRSTRAVQVLARAPLAPRQHVVLLLVGRRVIVIGDCGSQMNSLCEITDGDEIAALLGQLQDEKSKLPARAFGAFFQRAKQDMSGEEEPAEDEEIDATGLAEAPGPEADAEPAPADSVTVSDPSVSETRDEITGLMAKIRVLSSHFRNRSA